MDNSALPSRRMFLKAAPAAAVVAALPMVALAAPIEDQPSAELVRLITVYEAAAGASTVASQTCKAVAEHVEKELQNAKLSIPLGREFMGERIVLDFDTSPDWVRRDIASRFNKRIAAVRKARAAQPEIAHWLGDPKTIAAERVRVLKAAEATLATYSAIINRAGVAAVELADGDAYDVAYKARKALLAYRLESIADARAMAAVFWRGAKATGHWHEIPTVLLIEALCPELAGKSYS
jgi:hypothetical protein